MGMTVSEYGLQIFSKDWQNQHENLSELISEFCKEQYPRPHPSIVLEFLACIDMDLCLPVTELETKPGLTWKERKGLIQILIDRADDLLEFGNDNVFPRAMEALEHVRDMLLQANNLIPE